MKLETSHDFVNELLPWYANSTLTPEEGTIVEKHLETCADCREELQALLQISTAMKEAAEPVSSVEASLARTFAAIDAIEEAKGASKKTGLAAWLDALWSPSVPVARIAFATQFALILLLGVFLVTTRENSFTTTSGSAGVAAGVRLDLMFAPTATEETMRALLMEVGGTIVSGPSAAGYYTVELSGKKDDDPQIDATIEKLRKNTETVRFVERKP